MERIQLDKIKELLAEISKESYQLCENDDLFISSSAAKINNNSYLIRKILQKLPNYE